MDYARYVKQIEALYLAELPVSSRSGSPVQISMTAAQVGLAPMKSGVAPTVLIVSPHPDDECLMGSYALRLKQELGAKVYVQPFSLGSDGRRQSARDQELNQSIAELGFERLPGVADTTAKIFSVMSQLKPQFVFSPHGHDAHSTHIKASVEVRAAIAHYLSAPTAIDPGAHASPEVIWLQTEYWQNLPEPNLMVCLNADQVIQIGQALMKHQGEIARNPFHLTLPAWYMDQVRRGSERVLGAGQAGVKSVFAQLYTQKLCKGGDPALWVKAQSKVI